MSPTQFNQAAAAIKLVCDRLGTTPADLESHKREFRTYVWPRWVLIHLLYDHIGLSDRMVGLLINRNHSSIVMARRAFADELAINPTRRAQVKEIESAFSRHV